VKAVRFHRRGGPEVLALEEVPEPEPGPGEVRVCVRAAALNHLDLWVRRGLPIRMEMPHVGGADFAGVVDAVGEGEVGLAAGDEVVGYPLLGFGDVPYPACGDAGPGAPVLLGEQRNGAFCERLVLPAANLVRKPGGLSFEEAASVPVVFLTAWSMLRERAALAPGETVLVMGAGSGVGTAALQIARDAGARSLAVTRSAWKAERLRELGADEVLLAGEGRLDAAVLRATARRGADVVVDHVGGEGFELAVACAASRGRVVTCGATAGRFGRLDLRAVFARQLRIEGVTLGTRAALETVLARVAAGRLRPVLDRVLPLHACREAHELLEAGGSLGKIVLRVSG
jgi:NADPH:quinone reductase-like Zn-dependent oxidoreductase